MGRFAAGMGEQGGKGRKGMGKEGRGKGGVGLCPIAKICAGTLVEARGIGDQCLTVRIRIVIESFRLQHHASFGCCCCT